MQVLFHTLFKTGRRRGRAGRWARLALLALLPAVLLAASACPARAEADPSLPDAPTPQMAAVPATPPAPNPCDVKNAGASMAATAAVHASAVAAGGEDAPASPQSASPQVVDSVVCVPHLPIVNWYARFLNGPQVKALTPLQKAHLAARNVIDPFNLLTIFAEAGISVAANSHSPYGPGMTGFGKNAGVSLTQDVTGEFVGTFLIPSIARQDPHYHRMPTATIKRRIAHAFYQIVWTRGDNGKGMLNYADLLGYAIDDQISNLYVPGRETNAGATASRYGIALATAPIDNFITEFLPDVASHIHIQIVVIQRIINQVAKTDQTNSQ
jgi:hypothetical protein